VLGRNFTKMKNNQEIRNFFLGRYVQYARERRRMVMDAKYNFIIDSMKWRIALNLAGFAVWLAVTVALFKVAS
jgi:hypothetical protein